MFGGSYGWSSAGRFHHAQSQVHRFLNIAMGGYVRSVNTYSSGASSVLLPQILAGYEDITRRNVTWEQIAGSTEIVLAFGGMALKNSMVAGGSISKHVERAGLEMLYIEPGSPWENGFAESFFSRLRDELLNCEEFANLAEARWFARRRQEEHNEERPHSSLNYQTPSAFAAGCAADAEGVW